MEKDGNWAIKSSWGRGRQKRGQRENRMGRSDSRKVHRLVQISKIVYSIKSKGDTLKGNRKGKWGQISKSWKSSASGYSLIWRDIKTIDSFWARGEDKTGGLLRQLQGWTEHQGHQRKRRSREGSLTFLRLIRLDGGAVFQNQPTNQPQTRFGEG